jgi:RHS repeat-associated protein
MRTKIFLILNPNPIDMRKLFLALAVFLACFGAFAQNPFAELGYTPKIATLSQGQFNEFFDNDTIVQIGSVLYNTKSKQIVAFVQTDTLYSEATLQPDIVSRWLSPDPLADHPTQVGLTPYHFAGNNPIYWNDPDGRCPWCIVWAVAEVGMAIYDAYETGATIIDPKASAGEKVLAAGGFALGAILPGGGYGKGAKEAGKAVNKVVDASQIADKANDAKKVINKTESVVEEGAEGIVYKRTNPKTAKEYIGKSKDEANFVKRQKAHDKSKGVKHDYDIVERANPGKDLSMAEEKHIRRGGGPENKGGKLENKRYEVNDPKYKEAGGSEPKPTN